MSDARRSTSGPDEHAPSASQSEEARLAAVPDDGAGPPVETFRLTPLLRRRQHPWLVVDVDGTAAGYGALVWALREAARREATVVAVCVLDDADPDPLRRSVRRERASAEERLEAQVLRAIAETGVVGRARTAVLERPVFDALTAAARGADLVVVGAQGKTLLRPAVPRPHLRRVARGA
jgi:nucleotide-binding universal stress UspA family protein